MRHSVELDRPDIGLEDDIAFHREACYRSRAAPLVVGTGVPAGVVVVHGAVDVQPWRTGNGPRLMFVDCRIQPAADARHLLAKREDGTDENCRNLLHVQAVGLKPPGSP